MYRRQARENAYEQFAIGFGSDWLKKWRELFLANHNVKATKAFAKYFRLSVKKITLSLSSLLLCCLFDFLKISHSQRAVTSALLMF